MRRAAGHLGRERIFVDKISGKLARRPELAWALTQVAEAVGLPRASHALGEAFARGSWLTPLPLLAKILPQEVIRSSLAMRRRTARALGVPRQGIYGYLPARHVISALICKAANAVGVGLDRVRFERTVRRRAADPAVIPAGNTWTASSPPRSCRSPL